MENFNFSPEKAAINSSLVLKNTVGYRIQEVLGAMFLAMHKETIYNETERRQIGRNLEMTVGKKTLCSAMQLPLTLSMASFLVIPDIP